jgi:CMP-N-acetylneuraminic acid synthetase
MTKIVAIIPARSGSKGIPDKNIRLCDGKPLLAYSIEHALKVALIDKVVVSTDSELYAKIAREYNAEVIMRPADISQDNSLDIETFYHSLKYFKQNENYCADICVHLRPTHPIRKVSDTEAMIKMLLNDPSLDSVRSITPSKQTPYKMWLRDTNGTLCPVATCNINEAYNAPRQTLPVTYLQSACVDVVQARVILDQYSMSGHHIAGYIHQYDFDIDTHDEFLRAELFISLQKKRIDGCRRLTICCDIDGIIAEKTINNDYSTARPLCDNIALINAAYYMGHEIILFTARGSLTNIDWRKETEKQMRAWGVRYSVLKFEKPTADIYIDDRFVNLTDLQKIILKTENKTQ